MTQFKIAESPFKSDNTASNMCGITLMNSQVGQVVAEVMRDKPNVTVTPLPSMIRVDALNRMDIVYDEVKGDFPHPNTMRCKLMGGDPVLYELEYYSVGGGFI